MTTRLHLTRRICQEIPPHVELRSSLARLDNHEDYEALRQINLVLDQERACTSKRGGARIDVSKWSKNHLLMLRDILRDVRERCVQMQIRRAVWVRINQLEDYLDISAVDRLGGIE